MAKATPRHTDRCPSCGRCNSATISRHGTTATYVCNLCANQWRGARHDSGCVPPIDTLRVRCIDDGYRTVEVSDDGQPSGWLIRQKFINDDGDVALAYYGPCEKTIGQPKIGRLFPDESTALAYCATELIGMDLPEGIDPWVEAVTS